MQTCETSPGSVTAPSPAPDPEGGRLLWHCRRGMKELDVVLERFVRARLPLAAAAERGLLAELLALSDPQLAEYLLGGVVPRAARLAALVARIRLMSIG